MTEYENDLKKVVDEINKDIDIITKTVKDVYDPDEFVPERKMCPICENLARTLEKQDAGLWFHKFPQKHASFWECSSCKILLTYRDEKEFKEQIET